MTVSCQKVDYEASKVIVLGLDTLPLRPDAYEQGHPSVDLLPLTGGIFQADLSILLNLTPMKRRVFDETFRQMALDLSYAKGSVREAAEELGIDSGRISK